MMFECVDVFEPTDDQQHIKKLDYLRCSATSEGLRSALRQ